MKRIVVGVNDSETARRAAEEAGRLAAAFDADLHLLCALRSNQHRQVGSGGEAWAVSDRDLAERFLEDLAQRLGDRTRITTAVVVGSPARVLVDEAVRIDADLIVVGNRRMQGAGRLLGAVADDVAHRAPCSVYIADTRG